MKEFDQWNIHKKAIESNKTYLPFYYSRQIRWCRLGVNIGFEQDGTGREYSRPVLILRGFSKDTCLILPLTTSKKKSKYLFPIGVVGGKEAQVIISQIRLIDVRRLDRHINTIDKITFHTIRKAVKDLL